MSVGKAVALEPVTPLAGLLPLAIGTVRAEEIVPAAITSVAPFQGAQAAVSEALAATTGLGLPGTGQVLTQTDGPQITWAGKDLFFVLGARLGPIAGAAMTDQSDAWASAALTGPGVRQVLARLVPIDLRDTAFPVGSAARTLVGHMSALVMRIEPERYELMVFRSMARTLAHDLKEAMETVAARR